MAAFWDKYKLWIIVGVIILVILIFIYKYGKKTGQVEGSGQAVVLNPYNIIPYTRS